MPKLGSVTYEDLCAEGNPPQFVSRRDLYGCTRRYSIKWDDVSDFDLALRGSCFANTQGSRQTFFRFLPHFFYFQNDGGTGNYPLMCVDVPQIQAVGWLTEYAKSNRDGDLVPGDPNKPAAFDPDDPNIAPFDKAHITADYQAVRFPIAENDDTNEPVGTVTVPADGDATRADEGRTYEEWQRFTEVSMEWGTEILQAPLGSYVYTEKESGTRAVSSTVNIATSLATVTMKVWGLPMIPPAAFRYASTVNQVAMTVFLNENTEFTFDPETLLLQAPVSEPVFGHNATVKFNMIYRFIYRPQRHNFFYYNDPATKRYSFERIAVDKANKRADGSAPFSLRNFGYLWSPRDPG